MPEFDLPSVHRVVATFNMVAPCLNSGPPSTEMISQTLRDAMAKWAGTNCSIGPVVVQVVEVPVQLKADHA